jgi:hypothetical protein
MPVDPSIGVDRVLPALPDLEFGGAYDADVFGIDFEHAEDASGTLVDRLLDSGQRVARRYTNVEHEVVVHARVVNCIRSLDVLVERRFAHHEKAHLTGAKAGSLIARLQAGPGR